MTDCSLYLSASACSLHAGVILNNSCYLDFPTEEHQENDYNLNIPRYVDTSEEEEDIDLMAVRKERLALQKELDELGVEMAGFLEELGYGA